MSDGVNTAAGVTLSIGTTASNPATDTYTVVGDVTSIPELGRTYNVIKYSPLSTRGTLKFKGSFDDGTVMIELGKNSSDAGQAAMQAALATDFNYNFKVVANDAVAPVSAVVTISDATPGVITDTAHGLAAGTEIELSTTGTLPTGLSPATPYYLVGVTTNTYELAATLGGSAINTSSAGSGVHTRMTVPSDTTQVFSAQVTSFTTIYGTIDNIISSKVGLSIQSGSLVETARLP